MTLLHLRETSAGNGSLVCFSRSPAAREGFENDE